MGRGGLRPRTLRYSGLDERTGARFSVEQSLKLSARLITPLSALTRSTPELRGLINREKYP